MGLYVSVVIGRSRVFVVLPSAGFVGYARVTLGFTKGLSCSGVFVYTALGSSFRLKRRCWKHCRVQGVGLQSFFLYFEPALLL